MPFTLAHPAGVLPLKWLKRSWFSTTGLVVGSMAPDYEYFMKQYPSPSIGETFWGAALFDFPLALIVAFVYHLLVKPPLVQHLPAPYDYRYSGYLQNSFLSYLGRHWLVFISSIILGIASHLLLDWSTHPFHGPFRQTALTSVVTIGPIRELPLLLIERLFDGLATVILFLLLLRLKNPVADYARVPMANKWVYWGLALMTIAALVIWEWQQAEGFVGFAHTITTLIWAIVCGLVVASVLIKLVKRNER